MNVCWIFGRLNFVLLDLLYVLLRDQASNRKINATFRCEGLNATLHLSQIPSCFVFPCSEHFHGIFILTLLLLLLLGDKLAAVQVLGTLFECPSFRYDLTLFRLNLLHLIEALLLLHLALERLEDLQTAKLLVTLY